MKGIAFHAYKVFVNTVCKSDSSRFTDIRLNAASFNITFIQRDPKTYDDIKIEWFHKILQFIVK